MQAETYQNLLAHGAAVNLSTRSKWKLSGADRVRYLNGQVTNDVRRADERHTIYACVTDVKGRIAGDVMIHSRDGSLWLDAEPDLRETLGMRLEKYIVADDAELTDVTDDWQLWHVFGPRAGEGLQSTRFGLPGIDVWIPAGGSFQPAEPSLSLEDAETLRVLQKVPRWPNELGGDTFPPEAGLEERAMDFAKGCYIGQEILSRIKTTGKMPRQLQSWETDREIAVGTPLHDFAGREIGAVTSTARHPQTEKLVVLGFVKSGAGPVIEFLG
ncbi:MAG: YgfZ/GcvT domain-containing protein [Prosthecobacter sp.]